MRDRVESRVPVPAGMTYEPRDGKNASTRSELREVSTLELPSGQHARYVIPADIATIVPSDIHNGTQAKPSFRTQRYRSLRDEINGTGHFRWDRGSMLKVAEIFQSLNKYGSACVRMLQFTAQHTREEQASRRVTRASVILDVNAVGISAIELLDFKLEVFGHKGEVLP